MEEKETRGKSFATLELCSYFKKAEEELAQEFNKSITWVPRRRFFMDSDLQIELMFNAFKVGFLQGRLKYTLSCRRCKTGDLIEIGEYDDLVFGFYCENCGAHYNLDINAESGA